MNPPHLSLTIHVALSAARSHKRQAIDARTPEED